MSAYQKLGTEDDREAARSPPSPSTASFAKHGKLPKLVYLALYSIFLVVVVFASLSLWPASALSRLGGTGSRTTLSLVPTSDWSTAPSRLPLHNATIVILVNPDTNRHQRILVTLQNIEEKFNRRLGYPIQLLINGELPGVGVRARTHWITGGKAKWSLVTKENGWGPPAWINLTEIQDSVDRIGFSEGYRNMCRFFSMQHWKHPAVAKYEWIWRLDDTSRFHCALMDDPIELMINASATYGYSQIENESLYVVPTLWETTQAFIEESRAKDKGWIREGKDENWLDLISDDKGRSYNLKIFYNNFEIAHRRFFESEPYQAYVKYLDRAGGFYRERWGDAPVRTIATALFLPRREFFDFSSITGYQHEHPNFVCPDYAWCDCDPEKSGKNGGGNW